MMFTKQARHPQGDPMILKVLIDSGAEANLVRYDLFPKSTLKPSPAPLTLVTANGELMGGGRKEITLTLQLLKSTPGQGEPVPWTTSGTFYDADIKVDAIVGCPWLGNRKLGIFPHLNTLAFLHSSQTLLHP